MEDTLKIDELLEQVCELEQISQKLVGIKTTFTEELQNLNVFVNEKSGELDDKIQLLKETSELFPQTVSSGIEDVNKKIKEIDDRCKKVTESVEKMSADFSEMEAKTAAVINPVSQPQKTTDELHDDIQQLLIGQQALAEIKNQLNVMSESSSGSGKSDSSQLKKIENLLTEQREKVDKAQQELRKQMTTALQQFEQERGNAQKLADKITKDIINRVDLHEKENYKREYEIWKIVKDASGEFKTSNNNLTEEIRTISEKQNSFEKTFKRTSWIIGILLVLLFIAQMLNFFF